MTRSFAWRAVFLGAVVASVALFFRLHVSTTPPPAPDYDDGKSWLCRPGRDDACAKPTTATVLEPGGGKKVVSYPPNAVAPVDCFYLYPTVSQARTAYSPIEITEDETRVVRDQFARFSAVCRPFAPLYRQVTLAGLPGLFRGEKYINLQAPYRDVATAWKTYLEKDNDGRAVVLIGHSQGARLLAKLMADEIDGKPIQSRLVVAILPGAEINVPTGHNVGGSFEHIPLCNPKNQIGCTIAYSAFPAGKPIPTDARFGASSVPRDDNACVNPQAIAGNAWLDADLPLDERLREKLGTDFAELPGLVSGECKAEGRFNVLAVKGSPEKRLSDESTEVLIERLAQYTPATGLHALDINLALGTLVDLVRQKSTSFARH